MKEAGIVVRGSTVRVVGLAANVVVGFFLMPFLVHALGDRAYGYWTLAGAILGYYGLLDLGIVSAVQYHVAKALGEKDPLAANRAISTSFFVFGTLGALALAATIILASLSHKFGSSSQDAATFRNVLLIMGVGFAIGFPGRAFIGAISAHLRWDMISGIGIAVLLLRACLIVAGVKAGYGVVFLASVTVACDVVTYLCYYRLLKSIQPEFHLSVALASLPVFREICRYSVYTFVVKVSDQLRFYIDVLIVSGFVGVVAVTHYSVASRLALSYLDFMIALMGLLSPWFSLLLGNKDYLGIRNVLAVGTKFSVSVSTLIACCLLLYGKPFIQIWMGKNYVDAYWPLVFLVSGIFFDVSQQPSVSYMFGVSRHRFLAYVTLLEGIANVGLSLLLVRTYGLAGVALGTAVPMLIAKFFVQPIYVCRQSGIPLMTYYVGLTTRSATIAAISVIAPWLLVFRQMVRPTLMSIGMCVICQTIVAVVAIYLCVFTDREKGAMAAIIVGERKTTAQTETLEKAPGFVPPKGPVLGRTRSASERE
jgi:O-antigen/teichoic acid export membrane protein